MYNILVYDFESYKLLFNYTKQSNGNYISKNGYLLNKRIVIKEFDKTDIKDFSEVREKYPELLI